MLRALLARQHGDNPPELDDLLRQRWTSLVADSSRELTASFAESLSSIDISTPDGALLLCSGTGIDPRTASTCGATAVFRLSEQSDPNLKEPLVFAVNEKTARKPVTCARWMRGDAGLFVSGDADGNISVWDTSCFAVALRTELGKDEEICALDMSGVPGGRSELVVVARRGCYDVTLFDLGTGACTHRLEGHSGDVMDVAWSPTNPFMLASCARDGAMRLFDVRRSGRSACLVECVEYHSRHIPVGIYEHEALDFVSESRDTTTSPPTKLRKTLSTKRSATGSSSTVPKSNDVLTMRTSPPLGLGCIWESNSMSQLRRRKRHTQLNSGYRSAQLQPCLRVRFTPDGLMAVCGSSGPKFRCWDVPTGRLIARRMSSAERWRRSVPIFEMARDGFHMLSDEQGCLRAHSLEDGTALWRRAGHFQPMSDMGVHPIMEEVYTCSENQVLCWSPASASAEEEVTD